MRTIHTNIRNYDQPFSLLEFEKKYFDGVLKFSLKNRIDNICGSAMNKNSFTKNSNSINEVSEVSLVMQNPPFIIDINLFKISLQKQIYIIKNINYNWFSKGDIQLSLIFERNEEENDFIK